MAEVSKKNHYEKAFESWLCEKNIQYVSVDQKKRAMFKTVSIKSFDLLIPAKNGQMLIAEVKGRKFKADSLKKTSALQSWVNMDDVDGLENWQQVFGDQYLAVFAFVYQLQLPEVDLAGNNIFHYSGNKYCFFIIPLSDYKKAMVLRSPKWRTVTLLTDDFKQCAKPASDFLLN